jgi:hypothetical protein
VESSANLRDWNITYHSRSRIFTAHERNSKKQIIERKRCNNGEKYNHISARRNGPNGTEECCLFLRLKALSIKLIHRELVAVLQENDVSYSSVTRFCRKVILGLNSREVSSLPKNDGIDEMNEAILLALSDESFSSGQQIARGICVPKSTVYRRFVDSLHFTVRHLHSVRHKLSDSQKARSAEPSYRSNFATYCW